MKKLLLILMFVSVVSGFEAFDDFNRSDNQTLNAGNWFQPSSGGTFTMSIKDSCASSTPTGGTTLAAFWATSFSRDQFSQFKIVRVYDKTRPLRLFLHGSSAYTGNKTEAVIYQDSAVIFVNGTRISAVSETFPNTTTVRFSSYGDSLYLHKNNAVVLTVFENTNSSGYIGIGIHGYNDATNYHKIDDFLGGVYNIFDWDTIVGTPAEITQQPVSDAVNDLDSAQFYVTATGSDLTYQWYIDNVAVSGATTNTFEFLATTKYSGSQIFCKLTTDTIISTDTVILTVNQTPPNHTGWPLERLSWNVDKAYPGIEYNYRLGIKGGEYPYRFALRHGPSGMTCDTITGELKWTPASATIDSVRVSVKDILNDSLVVQYVITATTTGFYFVDSANGNNGNAGTEAAPWLTMAYASATADSSSYVYVKKGTYPTEAFNITTTMCKRFIAYPGETVSINSTSDGPNTINMGASGNSIFQGLIFDGNDRRYLFSIQGYIKNLIWRNNTIHNVGDGGSENPAGIFFWGGSENPITGGNSYDKVVVQDNLFYDINGSSIVSFDVKNMLFENNTVHDIPSGAGNGISDKDMGYMNTFRGNLIYNCPNGIVLMTQGGQSNIEICYNHIYGIAGDGVPIVVGVQAGYINDVFIHHNTVLGGMAYSGGIIGSSDSYNINTFKNIVGKNSYRVYSVSGGVGGLFFPNFRTKILIDSNMVSGNADSTSVHLHWTAPTCNWAQWQDSGKDNNSKYMQLTYDSDSIPVLSDSLLNIYGHLANGFTYITPEPEPDPPVITDQPDNATVSDGSTASFTIAATNATGYQWYGNGSLISGATGTTYSFTATLALSGSSIYCMVYNAADTISSDTVTLSVVSSAVGYFNGAYLTVGLFKQPTGTASKNTGTIVPVKGPNAPTTVTATLENLAVDYGWRSDLQSYRFGQGINNIVYSNDIGDLSGNKLTVACWMKVASVASAQNIWAKVLSASVKIVIHRQHNDTFEIRVCNGSSASIMKFLRPSGHAEPNTLFSMVTVIDVTQAVNTDRIKVYVDGIACSVVGTPGTIPTTLPNVSSTALRVGGWGAADPLAGINGEMYTMLTFNTAKTSDEVSALHALGPNLGGLMLQSDGTLAQAPPIIIHQSTDTLKLTCSTNPDNTKQWVVNGVDVLGATDSVLRVPLDSAYYSTNKEIYCRISNGSTSKNIGSWTVNKSGNKKSINRKRGR